MTIVFLSLFLLVNYSQADIFMKQKTQSQGGGMMGMGQGGGEEVQTIWITDNKLRSDQGDQSMIMLLDEKKCTCWIIRKKPLQKCR